MASGFKEFFMGTKGKSKTYPKFNKGQTKAMNEFLNFARTQLKQGGITNPAEVVPPPPLPHAPNLQPNTQQYNPLQFDVEPLAQQAQAQFQQQTIPSIAERFTSAGAGSQGSSAFAQQLGGAGADLQRNLAGLRSLYGFQTANTNEQNRLGVGRFNEANRLAYGQENANRLFQTGSYNQQLPFQAQQQNIGNLLSAQSGRLSSAAQFGGIGLQSPYERAYFPGQPGALQGIAGGIGQGLGTAASLLPFLL